MINLEKKSKNNNNGLLKVESIIPLFPVGFTRAPIPPIPELHEQLSRPIIELKLENNKQLRLMGIPYDIALEIWFHLKNRKNKKKHKPRRDPRLTISELVCEIARIDRVVISDILPDLGVYVANVYLKVDGEKEVIEFTMIPSHAILLALLGDADIYVAEKLLKVEEEEEQREQSEEELLFEDITYW